MGKSNRTLSIVVTSRNDGHGGNLALRTDLFTHTLLEQVARCELHGELIIVEWNPPTNTPSIADALSWPKDFGHFEVRIITVPHEIHARLRHSDELSIYQMIAKNVGIRRAHGDWILATNPDILFDNKIFEFIACADLCDKTYYRATRHDLNRGTFPQVDATWLLQSCMRCVEHVQAQLCQGEPHTNACGDFTLMHRTAWERLGGYLEYQLWSPHIDSLLLFMAQAYGFEESILDWPIYHLKHAESWSSGTFYNKPMLNVQRDVLPLRRAMTPNNLEIVKNQSDWGLANEELQEVIITEQPKTKKQWLQPPSLKGWTIFTVPTAFVGTRAIQQLNAIRSWQQLEPKPEIILVGDDLGIEKHARELGCVHVPDVNKSASGTPFLDSVFAKALSRASHDAVAFVNTDIILSAEVTSAIKIALTKFSRFLISGLRWDVDFCHELDFENGWFESLMKEVHRVGTFHTMTGADYFVFVDSFDMPPYIIGRMAFDNWLLLNAKRRGIPVIDATAFVRAIHQNHGYPVSPARQREIQHNLTLWDACSPRDDEGSMEDSAWEIKSDGLLYSRQISGDMTT